MNIEDYTQARLDREGTFRVFPISWSVAQSTKEDSKSVAILFRFAIHQQWGGEEGGWSPDWQPGWYVDSQTWIVKTDGTLSAGNVKNLVDAGLWDGDFDKLEGACPSGLFVLVDVIADNYGGETRYKANWISKNADKPASRGSFRPASKELLGSLRSRFQSEVRAVAGGKPSAGSPTPPPGVVPAPLTPAAAPAPSAPPAPNGPPPPSAAPSPPSPPQVVLPPQIVPPPTGAADDPVVSPDDIPF